MSDAVTPAQPEPPGPVGFLLSLGVMGIASLAWFALIGGLVFALAYAAQGEAGVRALAELIDPSRLTRLSKPDEAGQAAALFALASMLYASAIAGCLSVALLWGGLNLADLLAWREPFPRLRLRYWPWLVAIALYHLAAGSFLRLLYPEFSVLLRMPREALALGMSFLAIVILAPLAEELFFRGWIYGALRARFSASLSIPLCTIVFAMAHWDGMGLYPLAVLAPGLVLTILRERTGSAKASFLAHAVYNFIGWAGLAVISVWGG
jgi:membrane protease YdiL (CAAX protease family)